MLKKILIANRGEIAARIIRTCQKMGIQTVAIYSEADQNAPHVKKADEAYLIGKPRVHESYLNIDRIVEVAKQSGADAIHPGYGLLSENATFCQRCKEEGIVFIGPTADVIAKMGRKIEARKLMEQAGVPLVPGINRPLKDAEEATTIAEKIGFPVMLKASSGGGGIGMQVAHTSEELFNNFSRNQSRAKNYFGDGAMILEKYIQNPRHIEIQILADSYGNTVYLWERECSIQRRNQKVIEEAPSPILDEETRRKMGKIAVQAAQSIGYENAGTMEFIVDEEKNFYFLEMNTRLQVEHPVTEEITGLDLVEWQIRIAQGESLPFQQMDIKREGHAIEARIYAEDPKTFFPSPGQITKLQIPKSPQIRHELGVDANTTVTPFYDPLIAKLMTKGSTWEEAIKHLAEGLEQYSIEGIKTNLPLLKKIVSHPVFIEGKTTTDFIQTYIKQ